tara:strand:+ start:4255 stop:4518 length:264 start_codon:yes stop_codon:yes gene_type:complete
LPDRFTDHAQSLNAPASHAFAIAPADGTDLVEVTRALYIGVTGSLSVTLVSGAEVTLAGVPGGSFVPLRVRQVKASGTTASAILGLV